MRRLLYLLAFLAVSPMVWGQGVQFEEISFEQALAKAKKENKMVFIDCYTSWCGPCKRMTKNVFPLQEVGEYMNPKFVNLKVDMEKGEGPELQRKYRVRSYPTFLILDAEGKVVHKFRGATGPKTFMANVGNAYGEEERFGYWEERYDAGERDKNTLKNYVAFLRSCGDARVYEVLEKLFACLTDEERYSEEYRFIYERVDYFPVGSEAWNFFVEHRDEFTTILGAEQVTRLLYLNYWSHLGDIFSGRAENYPLKKLKEMEREFETLGIEGDLYQVVPSYLRLAKVMHTDNIDKILTVCEEEFVKLPKYRVPRGVYKLYEDKMSEAQKERWSKLMEKLDQDS